MPPPRPTITLEEAAEHAGLKPTTLRRLLKEIRQELSDRPDGGALPPAGHAGVWPGAAYQTWALKMGLWRAADDDGPWLIGYAGLAWISGGGMTRQWLRKLAGERTGAPEDKLEDLPLPVRTGSPTLFDEEVMHPWLRRRGHLKRPYRTYPR